MGEPDSDRTTSLLDAATAVFLRYGFKKTSMDAVAQAAGLSRQGLYLHFATKEVLFRAAVAQLAENARAAAARALADTDRSAEDRIFGAFEALHAQLQQSEHMDELLATAAQMLGDALARFEEGIVADLARALRATGIAAAWQDDGVSAKGLAEHLYAASQGWKQRRLSRTAYLERMRVAARIACRGA